MDDLVAEVFVRAWRAYRDIDPPVPVDEILPWLFGFARRVLAEHYRAVGKQRAVGESVGRSLRVVSEPADVNVGVDEVRATLMELSESDREVLQLVAWEGLSGAELGTALGVSAGTAAVRLSRARKRFADLLDRKEQG